jgi:PhoD-like phosphatase
MPALVLGPILRHVDEHRATVWVETDGPATVGLLGPDGPLGDVERTWCVSGHHYALVTATGLVPGSTTPYQVTLDDQPVWPDLGSDFPPSRIRTLAPDRPLRLAFGSCRLGSKPRDDGSSQFGADALDLYAQRMMTAADTEWPDALLLLGDQVYADEASPETVELMKRRRDVTQPPYIEVADFEEYTALYQESWTDPEIRWLLSTVPSSMIFDDHDVRDDWNTSAAWRATMAGTGWWQTRIRAALMSYWIYQHLGNLDPDELAADPMLAKVRGSADGLDVLRDFAAAADREPDGATEVRWSYRRDLGSVRLLVIDTRCGRVLKEGRRSMASEGEFAWIEEQVEGEYEHLLVGSSLPWLLPRAIHDVESWNEALCRPERRAWVRRRAEKLRQAADLEHWAAFRASFDRLAALLARVGRGELGGRPATVSVLSGDVHHAYLAQARYPEEVGAPVFQIVCSPMHQGVPRLMRLSFRFAWSRPAELLGRLIAATAKVPPLPISWDLRAGPIFGNQIATLVLSGRDAALMVEKSMPGRSLEPVIEVPLTP